MKEDSSQKTSRGVTSFKDKVLLFLEKSTKATKQTLVYVVITSVLLLMSVVLSFTKFSDSDLGDADGNSDELDWQKRILKRPFSGESTLRFLLSLLILAGGFLKIAYSSYGMACLPLYLIKGTRSLADEQNQVG